MVEIKLNVNWYEWFIERQLSKVVWQPDLRDLRLYDSCFTDSVYIYFVSKVLKKKIDIGKQYYKIWKISNKMI